MQQPLIDLSANPFELFAHWMKEAESSEPSDPNAMSVATTTLQGKPSVRILLLKGFDKNGFVFYTNLESRKGHELAQNPHTALLFYWKSLQRQVRIEGRAVAVTPQEADEYFATRERFSRLGAIASKQSQPLSDRNTFEQTIERLDHTYAGETIPRPANWSGYRVIPESFEFWQARPYRLHDRAVWKRNDTKKWEAERLYP